MFYNVFYFFSIHPVLSATLTINEVLSYVFLKEQFGITYAVVRKLHNEVKMVSINLK